MKLTNVWVGTKHNPADDPTRDTVLRKSDGPTPEVLRHINHAGGGGGAVRGREGFINNAELGADFPVDAKPRRRSARVEVAFPCAPPRAAATSDPIEFGMLGRGRVD